MADDVYVFNEGQAIPTDFTATPSAGTFNRNTSVNPNIITEDGTNTTALGIHCYEIHSDSASSMGSGTVSSSKVNRLYPLNTTIESYAENKFDSTNYRVIIDTDSATGLKEGSHLLGSSSCTRDYFIVIYADNVYKHHVAKITEESLYEGNFYKFDFTPSLKENISAGTKVAIYQGPLKTDNVVAVGYGLLNDVATTEERHDKYVNVSRPTFYFYEGSSLEPNTKYTALKTSTNSTGPQVSVFKTAPITSGKLLDKSFFTHTATIVDVNKSNDDDVSQPKGINSYTAIGSNYTFAKATYAQSSLNIYDSDGGLNTYLQFVDSPERTQLLSTPYHLNTSKTVTTRGNQFEAKYYDTERILEHKIRDYEDIKIKEIIHTQNISTIPESALPGIFSRKSSTTIEVTGLLEGQDLRTLLYSASTGVWEPFFVDNYYYECAYGVATAIDAPVDGVQTITISDSRAVTSNFWSGSASVHTFSDKTAYRKFYSRSTGTILIGHEIDTEYDGTTITRNGITLTETESDIYNLEYSIQGTNYGRVLNVSKGDKNNGYVTLVSEPSSSYFGTYTSPLSGNLIVSKTVFEGKVESKETSVESTGAFKLSITGRDEIATLLNTPINRNYTYSQEYIYSTFSPYNTNYTSIGRTIDSISGAVVNVNADITGTLLEFGDVIYVRDSSATYYYLLGVVKTISGQDITLMKDSYITQFSGAYTGDTTLGTTIYKANKALLAGKTLDTSLRTTERATTLIGTADKGAVFTTGKYFNHDGTNYSDTENLSALGSGGETNGIDIDNLINTVNDSTTYYDSPVGFDFDYHTISSMVDLTILNDIDLKDGRTQYEVGYISPIVLGRVEVDNLQDDFIDTPPLNTNRKTQNIHLINGQGLPLGGYLHMLDGAVNADKSPKTFNVVFQDDPDFGSTVKGQYATRFNTPIWRYSNKSQSKLYRRKYSDFSLGGGMFTFAANDYYEKLSNFNFYLSAYKGSMSTIPVADFHADDTVSYRKDLPTERTGIDPVVGAKSYLMTRYPDDFHVSKYNFGRRIPISQNQIGHSDCEAYDLVFDLYDNYTGPLHIFSVGDSYPESKKNPNNIGFTETVGSDTYSRNLVDYAVVFKGQPRGSNKSFTHTNWAGTTTVKNRLDDDYFYQPIQTTEGDLRRMNLVRLTDVTYDALFNEVDYENYKLNNSGTQETLNIHRNRLTRNAHIVKSFPESGWSPIHITLAADISAGSTITVNDVRFFAGTNTGVSVSNSGTEFYLFTDPYNSFSDDIKPEHIENAGPYFIGKINTVNTSTNVITFVDAIQSKLYSGTGYDSGDRLYVIAVDSGTSLLKDYFIQGGKDHQLAHTSTSETATTGLATLNYNRTLALTNYGDGSTADDDGNGDAIAQENRRPIDTMSASDTHDVNAVLIHQSFHGHENAHTTHNSFGTQTNAEKQNFRWVCDGTFNAATLTLSSSNMLDFFSSGGNGADYLTLFTTTFDSQTIGSAVITISNAGSGYNGSYKVTNVSDTVLTLDSDASGTAASFSNAAKTDIVIVFNVHNHSSARSIDHITPHRLLQESGNLITSASSEETGYNFKYGDTDLVIVSGWQGNARVLSSEISKNISGSTYAAEPNSVKLLTGNIKGKKYNNTEHTMTFGKYLVYGDSGGGEATGILETNLDTGGDDFAGTTPLEVLFRPYIDVSSGVTTLTNSDDDSLNNTSGSKEKVLRIEIQTDGLKRGVTNTANHWVHFSNNLTGYYLYQENNTRLHKIVSHTVSKDTSQFYHYIRIDNADTVAGKLYLMRINQTCFYDFSPKKIQLNKPSSEYTKRAGYNEMIGTSADATRFMGRNTVDTTGAVNGVRSMYCMIEPDGIGGNYLIGREDDEYSYTNSFPTGSSYRVLITDGINNLDTEMYVSANKRLEFSQMKEMKGSPSVGSIFSITVNQNPSFKPESLSICAPFNISVEVEDVVDDILTSVGISYTKDTTSNNYYIGSNFTGENAYAAINNVLSFKKKKLTIDGNTIRVVSNEEEKEYRSIEFNEENNTHKITSIKKDKSLYDNFNEVVVFGDGVKGTAKNYREIKKRGSKTKEVYDFSLVTDAQVSQKAQQLLKLYTSLQSAIQIEVGDKIPLLQPGNIVSVYYPSEGIFRNDYMVIEIEKNIGTPTKLLLGEYNRDLANTFTMLISETRNLQGRAKQKVYTSVTSPNIDIQSLRVKFVKATITKNNSTATELGFTYTLGFNARMGL